MAEPERFRDVIRNYGTAEGAYKSKTLRNDWLCPRCPKPRFGWVCSFGRGLELTHGIDPKVCGTCDNNENNQRFDIWESGKCKLGGKSLSPCERCELNGCKWVPCVVDHRE